MSKNQTDYKKEVDKIIKVLSKEKHEAVQDMIRQISIWRNMQYTDEEVFKTIETNLNRIYIMK